MPDVESFDCLDLNHDGVVNDQVGPKEPDLVATEEGLDRVLPSYGMTRSGQRQRKSPFINRFQKTKPQLIVDLKETADYSFGRLMVLEISLYFPHATPQ